MTRDKINRKGAVKPSAIIISMVIFVAFFALCFSTYSTFTVENALTVPDQVSQSLNNSASVKVDEQVQNLTLVFENQGSNFLGTFCQTLIGDNVFCAGLSLLNVVIESPSLLRAIFSFINNAMPFEIPEIVLATATGVLVLAIIFGLVSTWRRFDS